MLQQELKLLNRLYQDAETGMLSIDKVIKKVPEGEVKKLLTKQYDMYAKFSDKCDIMAVNADEEIKDNNAFKKFKQTAMLYFSIWSNGSVRHIVEMMITGTTMGIVDTIKTQADCDTTNEELLTLAQNFKKIQEDFLEKLKKILYKV